ncbi:hypothetical protein CSC70_00710 [Pseudoxanthomonas kalamensis DSM 18571]|uniref:DUF4136 domain-containing protein n=1 Tax=Pseudoxanthomonas kalamensis TaxID=289483 RepID=UPI0013916EE6|nr:DUF4136 domain-containing protein [Pseudoxanthomonas kalamensis]KAF1712086.1 hypothetical protein CSC70_00710 [Pseudoxanthomonas kalamensis DSM 18571]
MSMKKILGVTAMLALAGCASTPTVHTDSDPNAQFDKYHSFTWIQRPDAASPLMQQRIVDAVNAQLKAKGWVESADADVAVAAHVATEQKQTVDTFYSAPAYAGWGWYSPAWYGVGMAPATTTVRTYDVGTLVVDLFDAKTKQAIWRGSASGTLPSSPEKLQEGMQAGVSKMFADFPPGSATK